MLLSEMEGKLCLGDTTSGPRYVAPEDAWLFSFAHKYCDPFHFVSVIIKRKTWSRHSENTRMLQLI